jgi:uncharacterized protein (TIGR02246 family)
MTTIHDDPTALIDGYVEAFNAGDVAALDDAFEKDAVVVPRPGMPMAGQQRAQAMTHLLSLGLPMRARVRHCYTAGDIALVVVDWSLRGTTNDGHDLDLRATATDVLRHGHDGRWRYVIDNPNGTA